MPFIANAVYPRHFTIFSPCAHAAEDYQDIHEKIVQNPLTSNKEN